MSSLTRILHGDPSGAPPRTHLNTAPSCVAPMSPWMARGRYEYTTENEFAKTSSAVTVSPSSPREFLNVTPPSPACSHSTLTATMGRAPESSAILLADPI